MKFAIDRADFLRALSHVQNVVERRTTIPILMNVLIKAEGAHVRLTATDLDIEVVEAADARVSQPGAATAPAHTLFEIVRRLPDGAEVAVEVGGDDPRLTLHAGRSRFALPILPPSDFPLMAADELEGGFEMERADLARLIDKTKFAISTEETRYYLNGVYLHLAEAGSGPVLRAVATDGHRLALAELEKPEGADGAPGVIVPRKAVLEARRLLDGGEGPVTVAVTETKIRFALGATVLTSKLIDGNFPDYQRVIPKDNARIMRAPTKEFAAAVDRVATISAEKSRSVKLTLSEDRLVLTVNNPDAGQGVEELSVDYTAEPMEIGFNARYLLDVAGQIDGDDVEFRFADAGAPTLVRDLSADDAVYVLMPLRV